MKAVLHILPNSINSAFPGGFPPFIWGGGGFEGLRV